MQMELIIRFDYGAIVPWVRKRHGGLEAIAGPDALILRTPIETRGEDLKTVAEFTVAKGERVPFVLTWFASHEPPPRKSIPSTRCATPKNIGTTGRQRCDPRGPWRDAVMRSLITLKGLTYAPTGGIVAAATTSLPEEIGGVRNWDYRYCWLRDATFTLFSLLGAGYHRRSEGLAGMAAARDRGQPVANANHVRRARRAPPDRVRTSVAERIRKFQAGAEGNAASKQFQLDVYGEVVDAMYHAQRAGLEEARPIGECRSRF